MILSEHEGETVTSKMCLSWMDSKGELSPRCLSLGGNLVMSIAGPLLSLEYSDNDKNRPVVWIMAGMDSASMFCNTIRGRNIESRV